MNIEEKKDRAEELTKKYLQVRPLPFSEQKLIEWFDSLEDGLILHKFFDHPNFFYRIYLKDTQQEIPTVRELVNIYELATEVRKKYIQTIQLKSINTPKKENNGKKRK